MKLSHILIKVNDLDKEVQIWRDKGFIVEYGTKYKPYNALIYFKDGPFIELFKFNGLPNIINKILILLKRNKFVDKMNYWKEHKEGLLTIVLENYNNNLNLEINILKKYNMSGILSNKVRKDINNNILKFKILFVNDKYFPDLMTYFNIDPKPNKDIHPNGIKGIKSISLGLSNEYKEVFLELCDDPTIKVFEGNGIKDIEYIK